MMRKKSKKYIILLSGILILFILGGIALASATSCSDSDNGKNYLIKGTVSATFANGETYSTIDYCSITEPNKVSEGFCIGNSPSAEWHTCESGVCQDGACVNNPQTCSENGGVCRMFCDYGEYNIGILNCQNGDNCCKPGGITDCPPEHPEGVYYCDSSSPHLRFRCSGGTNYQYNCGDSYTCYNGECVYNPPGQECTPSCSDSDNGKNNNIKGTITATFANCQTYHTIDYCSITEPNKVSEGFCIGNSPSAEWDICPSGQVCEDGKCTSNPQTCVQNDGTCREFCNVGEYNIGVLNCANGDNCCKPGGITDCPPEHPNNKPYCSPAIDENNYLVCNGGITSIVKCKGDAKCTDGTFCYGIYVPGISQFMSWLREVLFGNETSCRSCDAFAISQTIGSIVPSLTCTPKLIALPPQTNTTCALSYIKLALILIVPIFVILFGMDFFESFKSLKGKKKGIYRFLLSLFLGLILGYLVYVLFWFGLILFILFVIAKIAIKTFL